MDRYGFLSSHLTVSGIELIVNNEIKKVNLPRVKYMLSNMDYMLQNTCLLHPGRIKGAPLKAKDFFNPYSNDLC